MKKEGYRKESFPVTRRAALDAGRFGRRKHIVHALIEVDVTAARETIRDHLLRSGEKLSFTAFIAYCLGRAIASNPHLHAYMDWRRRLVIFDHVNVIVFIETDANGVRVPMPHVLKHVDQRDYRELHDELRSVQADPRSSPGWAYLHRLLRLPGIFRWVFAWFATKVPQPFRKHSGSVVLTAVGMFGDGAGWGIPRASLTLTVTLGGIAEKPRLLDGEIAAREYLSVTISIDHDIVDGAPAARFVAQLRQLLEAGSGLDVVRV